MLGEKRRVAKPGKASGSRTSVKETDYRTYQMTKKDVLVAFGKAMLLSGVISWLFYRNIWGMLVIGAGLPMFYFSDKKQKAHKRQLELRNQFKECIRIVTASMYAGYSVENSMKEAEKELVQLLGEKADMCRELHLMNHQIKLNVPIEVLLKSLAERSGVEEIASFGQVFGYAKRNGSDFARILRDTSERIGEKAELEREIQTLIAAKKLEQNIMNLMPLGILFFVDLTSPGFLQVMYTGIFGRAIMTICLLVYGGAYCLSRRIVDIKV